MKVFKSEAARAKVLASYDRLVAQMGVPVQERDIQTDYGSIHLLISGEESNPPLVLLHGVGDNSAVMWALNMKDFTRHFYCIAVDTPGGPGKSIPRDGIARSSLEPTDWIDQVVDALGLDQFYLTGVSNGGCLAYAYTAKRSERVLGAVCIEGGMLVNPGKSFVHTLMLMFPEILIPTRPNMIRIMKKLTTPYSDVYETHPEIIDHIILAMKAHRQQAMFIHKLMLYDPKEGAAVKDKLYFLLGGYRAEGLKDFIALLESGGYRYKLIDKAGHGVNHDRPDAADQEISSFLLSQ